jgi:hypothetical protein
MDKWYISANGRVTGPLNIEGVKRLIAKHNDLYGWNPSFSHWLPIAEIKELSVFLSKEQFSEQVSKELIQKFVNRKRDLYKKTAIIDSAIEATIEKMTHFEKEINNYKKLTATLAADVQDNIIPLEQKYSGIEKQLNNLQKALIISKQEINDTIKEFGELVLPKSTESNDDFVELVQNTAATPATISNEIPVSITAAPTEVVKNKPESFSIPAELRGTVVNYAEEPKAPKPSVVPIRKEEKGVNIAKKSQDLSSIVVEHQLEQTSKVNKQVDLQPVQSEKKGFTNKLKSVFGKQNNKADSAKLSDRLLLLEKEATEKVDTTKGDPEDETVGFEYEIESQLEDDSDLKKKRRRRRRI